MAQNELNQRAEEIINQHVYFAVGAGILPIPIVDMVAVSAVQMDMLKQLANLYDISFTEEKGKSYVSAIGGSLAARVGASFIKTIPFIGSIVGGVSMSILSGATTFAIGQVFKEHFEKGGDFSNVDVERAKAIFEVELEHGKKMAQQVNTSQQEIPATLDAIITKIDKLGELQTKGYLTEKEFTTQKKRLLDTITMA